MGKIIIEYFEGNRIYVCNSCQLHLSKEDYLLSKNFTGSSGRAMLFDTGYGCEWREA